MAWFWTIISICYYVIGWVLYIYDYKRIYEEDWEAGAFIGTIFGLWFFWAIPFYMKMHRESVKNDPYIIKFNNSKISNKSGIVINNTDGYYSNQKVYYNFPEENYCGYIDIDIRTISKEELDKIVKKLEQWGDKENSKIARINAYKECR